MNDKKYHGDVNPFWGIAIVVCVAVLFTELGGLDAILLIAIMLFPFAIIAFLPSNSPLHILLQIVVYGGVASMLIFTFVGLMNGALGIHAY